MDSLAQVFICFAAEDRYNVAEPIVYHLRNYGIKIWYDRHTLLLGDNRIEKNLNEGAAKCEYAIVVLSQHTIHSVCAMEELTVIKERQIRGKVTVFPILYELPPSAVPNKLQWVNELIFKEANRCSGTREICNHIACKITGDLLNNSKYKSIQDILNANLVILPPATNAMLKCYQDIDSTNLNSRVTMLYSTYLNIIHSKVMPTNPSILMVSKIFKRLFSETRLDLEIDYRELWLLENSICILIDCYLASCIESKT